MGDEIVLRSTLKKIGYLLYFIWKALPETNKHTKCYQLFMRKMTHSHYWILSYFVIDSKEPQEPHKTDGGCFCFAGRWASYVTTYYHASAFQLYRVETKMGIISKDVKMWKYRFSNFLAQNTLQKYWIYVKIWKKKFLNDWGEKDIDQ